MCDLNKPRMRSHTRKSTKEKHDEHFPRKSKARASYAESELSDTNPSDLPVQKKWKVNPLLLPGPSEDHIKAQGYITQSKSKDASVPLSPVNNTPDDDQDHQAEDDPQPQPKVNSPKGNLNVTTHGLVEQKKIRNFKCKFCNIVATSQKKLNDHHKSTQDKVACPHCLEEINMPSSLDRHVYSHKENIKYQCDQCEKHFAFESQLNSQKVIHKKLAMLKCNRSLSSGSICGKWFKHSGELKKHMKIHDKILWNCADCDYSTYN